jgi:hypothetical protein
MDTIAPHFRGERLSQWGIIFVGLAIASFTGYMIGTDAITTIVVIVSLISSIAWLILARTRWWLLMAVAGTIGGYFYFGFKLYPHEVALVGCFVPLLVARSLTRPGQLEKQRSRYPLAMYFLSFYLFAHWVGSNIYNRVHGEGGFGNVTRAYLNALWVILFLLAFHRNGSSKYIRAALLLTYLTAFARVLITVVTYLSKSFAYIPVMNYVLPGSTHSGAADLRASGLILGTVAVSYFLVQKSFLPRIFHALVFVASFVAVLFGAGRTALVLLCLVPVFAALIYRKAIPVLLSLLAAGGLLLAFNLNPNVLDDMPFQVQRSASILLFDKAEAAQYGLASSSDVWHERLRDLGFSKWTQDWNSFLFGTGIRPFDPTALDNAVNFDDGIKQAAKVGAYESGWWTVIAVTGLVGILAYLSVFIYALRRLVPIILKEKVRDHRHAFAFLAIFNIVIWLGLGWTNGGFPSNELFFAFVAVIAFEDRKNSRVPQQTTVIPHPPQLVPARRGLALARG